MKDLVSVIIPSYGTNTNPCRAIDSVLNQDYQNVEVVVVDDNGRGTEQQLQNEKAFEKYNGEHRFTYLVHDVNKGGSVARNTGAFSSKGSYLCFLDDDDEFAELDKISKQMKVAVTLDDTWAGTYSSLRIFRGEKMKQILAKNSGWLLEEFIHGNMSIGTAAPIITRRSFEKISGFDGSFVRHQDWEFYCRLMDEFKLKAVPEACYNRYYKMDVKKKSIDVRILYMDKYTATMRSCLKSLPEKKINTLMKRKYIPIVLGLLKSKQIKRAIDICKEQDYHIMDYFYTAWKTITYLFD